MEKNIFENKTLSDDKVIDIIEQMINVINKYSTLNGEIDEDLRQEIMINIYIYTTKNRKK